MMRFYWGTKEHDLWGRQQRARLARLISVNVRNSNLVAGFVVAQMDMHQGSDILNRQCKRQGTVL